MGIREDMARTGYRPGEDPAFDAVVKIGEHFEQAQNLNADRYDELGSRIERIERSVSDTRPAGGSLAATLLGEQSATVTRGDVRDIIGKQAEESVNASRVILADDSSYRGASYDPASHALANSYFKATMFLASPRYAREHNWARGVVEAVDKHFVQKAAYSGGTDASGGYAVPDYVESDIFRIVRDNGVAFAVCRNIPMQGDTLYLPNESNNFTAYWSAEAATLTGGETTITRNTINAKKLIARATFSSEAVEDIVFDLLGYVRSVMAERIAEKIDGEVFEGTGTNFTGLVTETSVNSVATTTTDGELLAYPDLAKAIYSASHASTRQGSVFVMNPAIMATIVGMTDSTGQAIFQYANVTGAPAERILGYPTYTSSALSVAITRGATGSTGNVYFGPFSRLATLAIRRGLRWEITDQVNWSTDSMDARMIGRFGFTVNRPAAFTKIVGCKQLS